MAKIFHIVLGEPRQNVSNGVLRSVDLLSKAQRQRGHTATILCIVRETKNKDLLQNGKLFYKNSLLGLLQLILKLRSLDQASIVYLHGGCQYRFSLLVLWMRVFGKSLDRYILVPRGAYSKISFERRSFIKKYYSTVIERLVYRNLRNIQFLDQNELEDSRFLFSQQSQNLRVIPNILPEVDRSYGRNNGKLLKIIFCGRFDFHGKGIDVLIDACSQLKYLIPYSHLTIVGPHSKKDQTVVDGLARKYGVQINLMDPRYGDEKFDLYDSHDLFVLPSRSEGQPTGLLEAIGYGIPCAATQESNLPDGLFELGVTRIPLNAVSMAEVFLNIFDDYDNVFARAMLAKHYVTQNFSPYPIVKKHEKLV